MRAVGTVAMLAGGLHLLAGLVLAAAGLAPVNAGGAGAGALADGLRTLRIGAALAIGGALVRLAADALDELRAMRAEAARSRTAHDAPFIDRGAAPAIDWDTIRIPARIDMVARHGEALGGAAWDLMRAARREGRRLPEGDALRQAREAMARHG